MKQKGRGWLVYVIISFLIFGVFFSTFYCVPSLRKAKASIVYSDSDLTQWRYDPYALLPKDGTFANVVHDPVAGVWRIFYHSNANSGTGTIRQETSTNGRVFGNDVLALGHGTSGTWDEKETGVPYVWYEAGQTRPWRLIYRGCRVSDGSCSIGLATSVDGIVWDRKDTTGNVLSTPVLTGTAGQWDVGSIDFGSIIKVGTTYYISYDNIDTSKRASGLATSTDLVSWTKYGLNPLFTGVTDYSDKNHSGTVDLTAGFFCGDMVYWPRADGTDRYVFTVPHYVTGHTTPSFDVYVSDTPVFTQANRTYVGQAFETASGTKKLNGYTLGASGADTPRIVTDDITRNVVTSTLTGNDVLMLSAVFQSGYVWNEVYLVHNKSLFGAILSNISEDFPVSGPKYQLAPTGVDATTKGLWLPGLTGTLRDMTGGTSHLTKSANSIDANSIDANGINFIAANSNGLSWGGPSGTISQLNAITGDFTLETSISFASDFTSSYRGIFALGSSGAYHSYLYISGAAGPTYTLNFAVSNSGSTKTVTQALGSITLNQMYRLAITRTGGKIYIFKDGVLLNAGGTAYAWTIDNTPNAQVHVGSGDAGTIYFWDGHIDEIRISDTARWTANYVSAALTYAYQPSGNIYLPVSDFGAGNSDPGQITPTVVTPGGTSVVSKVRTAVSNSDQSSTIGDFSNLPQFGITNRYQQFAMSLTTSDTSTSPTVSSVSIGGYTPNLAEVTPVSTPSSITTPSYTFSSDQAGTITYGGSCSSDAIAVAGSNTITFNALSPGTYSNCTITVTNTIDGKTSAPLSVSSFTISSSSSSSGAPAPSPGLNNIPTVEDIVQTLRYYANTPYVYFSAPSAHAFDLPFTFDASDSFSAKGIEKYGWDFGDGTTAEGMKVDHQYQSPGRYTVTLTVTDKAGKTATKQQTVDANPSKPTVEDISANGNDLVFKGKSYPKTIVHLDIHSNPLAVQTNTDDKGEWVYKINNAKEVLDAGDHTVLASAAYVLADSTELKSEPSKTYDFKVSLDGDKLKVEMGKTKIWQYVSLGLGLILLIVVGFVLIRKRRKIL